MDQRWLSAYTLKTEWEKCTIYTVQLYTVSDIYPGELFVKNFLQYVELDPSVLNESEAKFSS